MSKRLLKKEVRMWLEGKIYIKDILNHLTYTVKWSEVDQVCIAYCPEFDDIKTHADTPEQAIEELKVPLEWAVIDLIEDPELAWIRNKNS